MDRLTIRQKLYAVFGALIAIFACMSIYAGYTLHAINSNAMRIATEHLNNVLALSQADRALAIYRQAEYSMVSATSLSGQVYASEEMRGLAGQMDITFDNIEPMLTGDKADAFQEMRQKWSAYEKGRTRLEELVLTGQHDAALQEMASSEAAYQELDWDLGIIVDQSKDFIQQETNVAADRYQDAKILFLVLTIVVLVLSVSMALYLSRTIQRSVQYLMGISQEVADGNLTVPVEVQTQDEFGELTAAYKETIGKLHVLIDEIQRTSGEVSDFAAQLTENADQSAQATQQVATSVTNVAQSASAQGESIGTSQQEVVKMADELHGFEQKAESSSKAAERVDEIAQNGRKAMTGAVDQMTEISESVEHSATAIRMLAKRSTEIGQISDTIADIAEQTNLLALNAAIEAARAGEAGRGFSVVADEVRKLAEESGKAAAKIAELISSIQSETQVAVSRMERGTKDVEEGRAVIEEAGGAFQNITEAVGDLAEQVGDILAGARASAARAERITHVMEEIHDEGKHVAAETESVSAVSEEQAAAMDEVAEASRKLSELSKTLRNAAAKFRI